MQSVTASFSACVLPAASLLHAPLRVGAPGLLGGGEGQDRRGGGGVEAGLLLCGDVPPALLPPLNEPAMEKRMASVLPGGKWDAAAGKGASLHPPGVRS